MSGRQSSVYFQVSVYLKNYLQVFILTAQWFCFIFFFNWVDGASCNLFFVVDPIRIIGFDHRKSVLAQILPAEDHPDNLIFHIDFEKSSSRAVYDYFSDKLTDMRFTNVSRNEIIIFYSLVPSTLRSG